VVSQAALVPALEKREDRSHLTDSRPIRWDLQAATPKADAAFDALLVDLEAWEPARERRRRKTDRTRLRTILEALTLELWLLQAEAPTHWLAYARGGAGYMGPGRYRHPLATQETVLTVADFLIATGLAENRLGSYRRVDHGFATSGRGYQSRLRGAAALSIWAARYELTTADLARSVHFELIRLKGAPASPGGRKPLVDYEDNSETRRMRAHLQAWMAMMERHQVTLRDPAEPLAEGGEDLMVPLDINEDEERPQAALEATCTLYRVFNEERWDRGGRFYGGWWMGLPKRDRGRLLIDGEETVELDFASLHPRLCHQLNGAPLDPKDDAYDLPGVSADLRDVVKVAFMQLLNAQPAQRSIRPPAGAIERLRGRHSYRSLVTALVTKHTRIAGWFYQGVRSLELQAIDAAIAEAVLDYFTNEARRPILPVHDSFIVRRRDQFKLAETMALAYRGQLSRREISDPAPPIIRGWVDDDVEAQFNAFLSGWTYRGSASLGGMGS
jgi:hypothetical protein